MSGTETIELTQKDVKTICQDYRITESDYMELDDEQLKLKEAINSLPASDYVMFCLYTELASERKLAKMLGLSRTPISRELRRIRGIIIDYLENNGKNCISDV